MKRKTGKENEIGEENEKMNGGRITNDNKAGYTAKTASLVTKKTIVRNSMNNVIMMGLRKGVISRGCEFFK